LIDFAVEPNWDWFCWSNHPKLRAEAYRHIIDIFRAQQVKNITRFFHFNYPSFPDQPYNQPQHYYPWDDYIDRIWTSFYWAVTPNEQIQWLSSNIYKLKNIWLNIDFTKPFAILEFGTIKNQYTLKWFEDLLKTVIQNTNRIKAISIWHEKWQNEDGSTSDLLITSKILQIFDKLNFWEYALEKPILSF